jgi:hypothetical protein
MQSAKRLYGLILSSIQGESAKDIAMHPASLKDQVGRSYSQFASKAKKDRLALNCTILGHHAKDAMRWYTRIDVGCKDIAIATCAKAPLALEGKVQHRFRHHAMPHPDEVATNDDTTS